MVRLYTDMRREEVLTLRWERVDMDALTFRVKHTKTRVPLELPITRQLAAILERRLAEAATTRTMFAAGCSPRRPAPPATSRTLTISIGRISGTGGAKFWFHGLRNCIVTLAERELMLTRRSPSD